MPLLHRLIVLINHIRQVATSKIAFNPFL